MEMANFIDGEVVGVRVVSDILPSDTGFFFDSVEPVGSYTVSLRAGQEQPSCTDLVYEPRVSIGPTVAAVGEASFEIPVLALLPLTTGAGAEIDAVEFDLILPESISILAPALAAGIPLGDGMQKIEVREGDLSPVEQTPGALVTIVKLEAARFLERRLRC